MLLKLDRLGYRTVKMYDNTLSCFIQNRNVTDRRTDRQTDRQICYVNVLTRDKNDMHIQLSLSLHFYLLYLLLNSCDGKDELQRVFLGRLLVALKRAGCVVCWL